MSLKLDGKVKELFEDAELPRVHAVEQDALGVFGAVGPIEEMALAFTQGTDGM
ncbi:MAG: hypothetical protein AMXMBFR20_30720 [Planctomycetia bacterium]